MKVLFVTSEWPFKDQPFRAPFTKVLTNTIGKHLPGLEILPCQLKRNPINVLKSRAEVKNMVESGIDHIHAFGLNSLLLVPGKYFYKTSVSLIGSDVYGVVSSKGRYPKIGQIPLLTMKSDLKKLAGIRAVSAPVMDKVANYLKSNQPKIVLTDGVDFSAFKKMDEAEARGSLGWSSTQYHVFFPSNPERPVKNFELAKALINELKTKLNGELELHLPPMGKQEEMNVRYRASDITLLTSRHEGSPNVIKESLWCGTPVFSTDVGDVRQHLQATGYGATFQHTQEIGDVAHRMLQWLDFKRHNSADISEYCRSEFDVRAVARTLIDFWTRIA